MVLVFSTLLMLVLVTPSMLDPKEEEEKNLLVAAHVYDMLVSDVKKPFVVSQTMGVDSLLAGFLQNEEKKSEKEMESEMITYLTSIRDAFGYEVSYVVSDKTLRYYTANGIARTIDPVSYPYDSWYKVVVDSHKKYSLDINRDELNGFRWTVFVNTLIEDVNHNFLGICGVGVAMNDLQKIIVCAEKEYGIKINLINSGGLVKVDASSPSIGTTYIPEALADDAPSDSFAYIRKKNGGFRMTRYIPDLGWYLVIQDFNAGQCEKCRERIPLFLAFAFLLLLIVLHIGWKCTEKKKHSFKKEDGSIDALTGLPNRNYLTDSFGELGIFNTTRYKSLVVFDIDSFKVQNETRNGDKILRAVVGHTKHLVGDNGILFRWSGDEFVVFYEVEAKEAKRQFLNLCKFIREQLGVTLSVGIVPVELSESIKSNYHRAAALCYEQKAKAGNGVNASL